MDETETCPNCKTSKYNKPNMKLMINICAHVLCETCVEQLFFRGSGLCPKCNRTLKKNEFRDKIFEDTYIEKEVAIRRKYYKDLIRNENDFPSLKEFNDYLETVETLLFNLANEIDEEQSLKKIEEFKKEAKESAKNRSRIVLEPKKENPIYSHKPYVFYNHGPNMPSLTDVLQKYSPNMPSHPYQLACGFPPSVPVQRILSDTFADLYFSVRPCP
ncbi:unnamed protein product [Brachionus calyciflorus]|uniref:CDK-activating kinase assembly factor MAT1 n=1 Tax=Brachionus calyciflorus TaxID=104777 RepID=A0A813PGQ9_9BILA|nr:unnamed protein product [Brachionus calyciflorus]